MKVTIQLPKPGTPGGKGGAMSSATPTTPVPKLPPVDTKNLTPEALRDRISMLISVNSQIVDTPMADAPRPKRVSRQNSEPASKTYTPTSMKQLLSSQLSTTIAPGTAPVQATFLPASYITITRLVFVPAAVPRRRIPRSPERCGNDPSGCDAESRQCRSDTRRLAPDNSSIF